MPYIWLIANLYNIRYCCSRKELILWFHSQICYTTKKRHFHYRCDIANNDDPEPLLHNNNNNNATKTSSNSTQVINQPIWLQPALRIIPCIGRIWSLSCRIETRWRTTRIMFLRMLNLPLSPQRTLNVGWSTKPMGYRSLDLTLVLRIFVEVHFLSPNKRFLFLSQIAFPLGILAVLAATLRNRSRSTICLKRTPNMSAVQKTQRAWWKRP
jgi:hypothetical protein